MLSQVIAAGQRDFHFAGRHPPKDSADRPHQGQTVKTIADGGLEVRILRIECWHGLSPLTPLTVRPTLGVSHVRLRTSAARRSWTVSSTCPPPKGTSSSALTYRSAH